LKNHSFFLPALIILIFLFHPAQLFPQSGYKVVGSIDIGGEGGWDYLSVDTASHKLYVSNSSKIHIIDLTTNKLIGTISGLNGVHGIAVVPASGKGFISNGKRDNIIVFDLITLKVIDSLTIPGKKPDAIIYDPFSKRVFSFNGGSSNATAIDGMTGKVLGSVKLGGNPEFAASDEKGKMFVNLEEENAIQSFDPITLKVIATWKISPVESPSGLAIDLQHNRLFSAGGNKLMAVVDASSGKLLASVPIGTRVDGAGFDQVRQLAFSSNGEGTLTIIKESAPGKFVVVENIKTLPGARTMTVDQSTHKVYTLALIDKGNNKKSFGVLILEKK
jgi:DNA-binding beta-propeller fold protein YncE